jgi:hypothetical protein
MNARLFPTLLVSALCCGGILQAPLCAQQDDPFAAGASDLDLSDDRRLQARVQVEFIEVSHGLLTGLLFGAKPATDDVDLRAQVQARVGDGTATLVETMLAIAPNGARAATESIEEFIYPTEYDVEQSKFRTPGEMPQLPFFARYIRPWDSISAFETRATGVTLEVSPSLEADGHSVDLQYSIEITRTLREEVWHEHEDEWGEAPLTFPIFETWRSGRRVMLRDGAFELVTILNPRDQPRPPALEKRVLVFIRADVVRP